jgi:uncharacterized protein involved in outer membrane biogenesis
MRRLLKWLVLLIAALTVGALVILYNPSLVKGPLERYLSGVAGYPVSLQGNLDIDPGRTIEIAANNISVAGPDWAKHDQLVAVGHLQLTLHTASLFKKIIAIESLVVEDLVINLESDVNGAGNWITAKSPDAPTAKDNEQDPSLAIFFKHGQISNATLRFINGVKGIEHTFVINSLNHNQQADAMLRTSMNGSFNDRPVNYSGVIGPYTSLQSGRDIKFTASGQLGELVLSGNGLIDDWFEPRHPQFNFEMQGPDVDEITTMLGFEDLGSGEFLLRSRGGDVNGLYEVDISGQIGDITLSASARATDLFELNELDTNLAINGPSLGSFTRSFGIENWPDKPFSLKGDATRVGETLDISNLTLSIGGTRLVLDALLTNFPELDASRIKLTVTGDDVEQFRDLLGIPGVATGPFEIRGYLDVSPDDVELLKVDLKTSLGEATISGTLGPAPGYLGSKIQLHLNGKNANALMSAFDIDALPEQPFTLNTRIELVENGMLIERGVLVSIDDDRLELGGLVVFDPGAIGTSLELKINGQDLAQMLRKLVGDFEIPRSPYGVSGRVRVVENGLELENIEAEFEDIQLGGSGLVQFNEQLVGTGLDFELEGKNLSLLQNFAVTGDSLEIFVPGQPYQATGRFAFEDDGWKLENIKGSIGKTRLELDSLISNKADWIGSSIRFSAEGPGLRELLVERDELIFPSRPFQSSGQVSLDTGLLAIRSFNFETDKAHAKVDLELGWPLSSGSDTRFNVDIQGDNIRQLPLPTNMFEPLPAAFKIKAVGNKQGHHISLKQFDAGIGDLQVIMQGELDDDASDGRADIKISVTSENLSTLGSLGGEQLPALALGLGADFSGNAHEFVIRNLKGSLGESQLEGALDVSLVGPKPEIKVTVHSNHMDLRPFLKPSDPEVNEEEETNPERLIPATPIPLETLAGANIHIKLDITELRYLKDSIRNLVLDAVLKDGKLEIPQFSLKGPLGDLNISLFINPADSKNADVRFDLNANDLVLNLTGQSKDRLHELPAFDVNFNASGKGSNLQELAGSLNGSLYLASRGGSLEGVNLSLLDTFILDELFSLILPKSEDDDNLDITCAATVLKMTDGLVETDPALTFTTSQIALIAKGNLDLKTEKMHFNFNATPNKALKISATELLNPYILVGGTLSEPAVGVDPAKVILHGGAAIGTAGISVLAKGLIDRVGNVAPLCEEIRSQGQQKP